ncbi:MAG: TolC family protein [Bryobacterales bacterium]|nr:TolC family protein [Bryobacterales bacterium]
MGLKASRFPIGCVLTLAVAGACAAGEAKGLSGGFEQQAGQVKPPSPAPQVLSLEQCLRMAMENNHRRPASRFAVAMAEAQHRQALAGYWPQVSAKVGVSRTDEPLNFIFPASTMYIPPQTVNVPGGTAAVTIPANAFGPGFPPAAVQMPVSFPGQSITTSLQMFPIPEQNIKLLNPWTTATAANMTWLLFDGGMRKGYREQALGAVDLAKAEQRRTDLEISDSVTRLYYGALLARQLHQVGTDTLARMEVTLELTESMYKNGSEKVNKTDYLDNQVMVETIRSMVAMLARNEAAAEAALAYTMGLPWNATVRPSAEEIPYRPFAGDLNEMVGSAYEFNPDWARVEAGLRALEGAAKTARSGHYPKVAFTGQLHRWWNSYSQGAATPQNRAGWVLGLGAEIPVFNGLLTQNKVAEAVARIAKLKEEKVLLREGIGLQLRDMFLSLQAAAKAYQASGRAMTSAQENRELTSRAYQSELIETEKVIRAQLFESLMTAQHLKTRYDHLAIESQIAVVVGKEMLQRLAGQP